MPAEGFRNKEHLSLEVSCVECWEPKWSPEGLQEVETEVLEPPRVLLGAMWAQGERQERSRSVWGAAWAPQKTIVVVNALH